jgi:hypothetical protein
MSDQVPKCLRQQSKDFYVAGFDALVKRWDKCINVGRGYVEKYVFSQVRISHVLRFMCVCDLFIDSVVLTHLMYLATHEPEGKKNMSFIAQVKYAYPVCFVAKCYRCKMCPLNRHLVGLRGQGIGTGRLGKTFMLRVRLELEILAFELSNERRTSDHAGIGTAQLSSLIYARRSARASPACTPRERSVFRYSLSALSSVTSIV